MAESGASATTSAARWLKERQRANNPLLSAAVVAGTIAGIAAVVQLGAMAWAAHLVLVSNVDLHALLPWLAITLMALLVRGAAAAIQGVLAARASRRIRATLRQELLEKVHEQGPLARTASSSGTLASEWLEQVDALHGYYAHFLPQMILCVSVPVIILAVAFWLDWLAALFLLLSAPLIPLFMALVGMGAEKLNQQHMESLGRLSGLFLDRVRGLTTLQLFQQTDTATADIARASDQFRQINMKTLRIAFLSSAVLEFFAAVSIAVIAIYVGFGLLGYIRYGPSPGLTLFSGLFLLLLAPEFFQPLRQLAQHYHDRATAMGAASQLKARLEEPGQAAAGSASPHFPDASHTVRLEQVTVHFANGRSGLNSVNLEIAPGELVVLRGPSGSGKSTLLHVIAGFLAPVSGEVSVLGTAAGTHAIGWLGQTPYLRHDTWAGNLRFVAPDASDSILGTALAHASLADTVSGRPLGMDSPLTEGGGGLSGGQARRLALARVFLAEYPLVLMDEPTAGLDARTEQQVLGAIVALRDKGVSIVVASHNQGLANAADRCLALDNGRLQA